MKSRPIKPNSSEGNFGLKEEINVGDASFVFDQNKQQLSLQTIPSSTPQNYPLSKSDAQEIIQWLSMKEQLMKA